MAATGTANGNSEVKDEFASAQHHEDESEDDDDMEEAEEEEEEPEEEEPEEEEQEEEDNTATDAVQSAENADGESMRWRGWPGDSVFRLIVPVLKVGGIIGRKGELIKKLCEETRARVRILEGAIGTNDRIVLISAKEEADLEISPAIDAVLRVFKRVNGLFEGTGDGVDLSAAASTPCSVRLLVPSSQAINLIGKQGIMIKSIQESTGATVRVLSADELSYYVTGDERIVEIYGETLKVLKTLEVVVGHLRKFLVDHSVLPLFEKNLKTPATHGREPEDWSNRTQSLIGNDYDLPVKRSSLYQDHESQLDSQFQRTSLSLYGQDPSLSGLRSSGSGLGRTGVPLVTQVTQTMQIPLAYAEDIIGIGGGNIAYIRRTSGAVLTVQETRGISDEITVEIKGTASQVQMAQQLIQEFIAGHKDHVPSSYGSLDTGLRSSYSNLGRSDYSSASSLGGYGSTGLGGYGSYRF